jgi:hypothetical protein
MRRLLVACALAVAAIGIQTTPAVAVTLDEVLQLSKSGVSDQVIIAMIERDRTIFSIDANQLVALKQAGVSEPVVLAMLRSGRDAGAAPEAAAPAEPIEPPPATVVVVGHGPDVPNGAPAEATAPVVFVPYPVLTPIVAGDRHHRGHGGREAGGGQPQTPVFQSMQPISPFHVGPELPPSPFHVGPTFPPFGVPNSSTTGSGSNPPGR